MYPDTDNDLVSIEELCQRLMIGKNMAYHLLKKNEIAAFRIGRSWKIPLKSVNDYVAANSYNKKIPAEIHQSGILYCFHYSLMAV